MVEGSPLFDSYIHSDSLLFERDLFNEMGDSAQTKGNDFKLEQTDNKFTAFLESILNLSDEAMFSSPRSTMTTSPSQSTMTPSNHNIMPRLPPRALHALWHSISSDKFAAPEPNWCLFPETTPETFLTFTGQTMIASPQPDYHHDYLSLPPSSSSQTGVTTVFCSNFIDTSVFKFSPPQQVPSLNFDDTMSHKDLENLPFIESASNVEVCGNGLTTPPKSPAFQRPTAARASVSAADVVPATIPVATAIMDDDDDDDDDDDEDTTAVTAAAVATQAEDTKSITTLGHGTTAAVTVVGEATRGSARGNIASGRKNNHQNFTRNKTSKMNLAQGKKFQSPRELNASSSSSGSPTKSSTLVGQNTDSIAATTISDPTTAPIMAAPLPGSSNSSRTQGTKLSTTGTKYTIMMDGKMYYQCPFQAKGKCKFQPTLRKSNFTQHMRIHDKDRPRLQCTMCPRTFGRKFELGRHIDGFHVEKEARTVFACQVCDREFVRKDACDRHMLKPPKGCKLRGAQRPEG